MPDLPTYPGTPRWVKVTGVVAAVLVLIFIALLHAGVVHGPVSTGVKVTTNRRPAPTSVVSDDQPTGS